MGLRYLFSWFLLFLLPSGFIFGGQEYVILTARPAGLFSIFFDVLALLKGYEAGHFSGVKVDFGKKGYYYDPLKGRNWWEYYFEPISLGSPNGPIKKIEGLEHPLINPWAIENGLTRKDAHRLITKYIRVKSEIMYKVDDFTDQHFNKKFIIGVHYRGTDKYIEAPPVSYSEVKEAIEKKIKKLKTASWLIFLATDEKKFLKYIVNSFPDRVVYVHDAMRSSDGNPVHIGTDYVYKSGEDAVVDCMILSRTNYLIRTSSNLSKCAGYFNPILPIQELNQRHGKNR